MRAGAVHITVVMVDHEAERQVTDRIEAEHVLSRVAKFNPRNVSTE